MSHGERITGESWLMRDLWQTTDTKYGARFGLATYPKRLRSRNKKSDRTCYSCTRIVEATP